MQLGGGLKAHGEQVNRGKKKRCFKYPLVLLSLWRNSTLVCMREKEGGRDEGARRGGGRDGDKQI